MGVCVPGASWVLLDSAGAATCSAASLAISVDGSRQTRQTQSPNSAFQYPIYAAGVAAEVVWCNGWYTSPVAQR